MLARFLAAAVLVGLGSCSTTLPPQRPVDFLIRLREDGGMVNRGLELQVSAELDLSVRFSNRTLVRVDNAVFPDHVRLGHGSYAMIVEYRWTPAAGEALRSVRHETQVDVTPSTRRVVVELGRGAARIVAE